MLCGLEKSKAGYTIGMKKQMRFMSDFETLSDMFCGFDSLPRQEKQT